MWMRCSASSVTFLRDYFRLSLLRQHSPSRCHRKQRLPKLWTALCHPFANFCELQIFRWVLHDRTPENFGALTAKGTPKFPCINRNEAIRPCVSLVVSVGQENVARR